MSGFVCSVAFEGWAIIVPKYHNFDKILKFVGSCSYRLRPYPIRVKVGMLKGAQCPLPHQMVLWSVYYDT